MNNYRNTFYLLSIVFLMVGNSVLAQSGQKFKVTLDAGHGDHDFGAVYHGHIEKNIALAVVLKVGKLLEKNPNIEVVYTRKTDVFIDLVERANIANRADANIFVSIHCNASKNTSADGSETFVMGLTKNASNLEAAKKENSVITLEKDYKEKYEGYDPNSPETLIGMTLMQEEYLENSIALAGKVQDNFRNLLNQKDRGVKQAPFMVLHKAYMPRVLIEMGFISNPTEGDRLDSELGQDEVALCIANAIINYKKEFFGEEPNEPVVETPNVRKIERVIPAPKVKDTTVIAVDTPKEVIDATAIVYKVQLLASGKKIDLVPSNFKGLNDVASTFENNLYKYTYGETNDYEVAKKKLAEAKNKGFATAFIIAFKDGKSINIKDVIK